MSGRVWRAFVARVRGCVRSGAAAALAGAGLLLPLAALAGEDAAKTDNPVAPEIIGESAARAADGRAFDDPDEGFIVTAALGVDSVGTFRGVRARRMNPTLFATLDIERDIFYAGAFASPVGFSNETVPLIYAFGGIAPTIAGVEFNLGAGYYAFPGSTDFQIDVDNDQIVDHSGKKGLFEGFVGVARDFEVAEVEFVAFYSPDTFGETGGAFYYAAELTAPLAFGFKFAAHLGASEYSKDLYNDDYTDYAVALKRSFLGFDFAVVYSNAADLLGGDEEVVVFGVKREFGVAGPDLRRARGERKLRNNWIVDKSLLGFGR